MSVSTSLWALELASSCSSCSPTATSETTSETTCVLKASKTLALGLVGSLTGNETTRIARPSIDVLGHVDGDGLGGEGVLLLSDSDLDSNSQEAMFCVVRGSRNGALNLIMICEVECMRWGRWDR